MSTTPTDPSESEATAEAPVAANTAAANPAAHPGQADGTRQGAGVGNEAARTEASRPRKASALTLAAMAAVAVPGLDPARLALPQEETETLRRTGVVDTQGRHWEVIQALTDSEGAALDAESEVLRRLAREHEAASISFDVPRPAGSMRREGTHVQVRSYVDGRPLDLTALRPGPGLSSGLGKALGELHELPVSVVSEAGLPVYDAEDVHGQWVAMLDEAEATGHVPEALVKRWREVLGNTALWRFKPTVVHGDLAEENILTAGGAIVALRGCAQMHVGDPAEDLAWVYSTAPVDCLDSIDGTYDLTRSEGVDKYVRERAEFVSEMSVARWLLHGVRTDNAAIVADACSMLEDLLAQVGGASLAEPAEPVVAAVPDGDTYEALEVADGEEAWPQEDGAEFAEDVAATEEHEETVTSDAYDAEGVTTPEEAAWEASSLVSSPLEPTAPLPQVSLAQEPSEGTEGEDAEATEDSEAEVGIVVDLKRPRQ